MTGLTWYLAQTGLALAAFYGLHRLALTNDTHFQTGRVYLLASLAAAHVLPLVPITSPFRQASAPAGALADVDVTVAAAAAWDWRPVVLWVYVAGAAFVLLRLAWHLRHLLLIARRHPAVRRDGVRVVFVDEDCPPFSFFRTAFVHRPAEGDERVLDQVVAHERTHIRQAHSLDIVLIQLAAVAQWFNPFIWLYKRSLKELHEYLADREVLAQGFDPFTYRQVLFEQHLGARSFEFAHHLRESQIKRRLTMMTRRCGPWTVCKYLLALPVLALLVVAFAEPRVTMAQGSPKPGVAAPAPVAKSEPTTTQPTEIFKKTMELDYKARREALLADYEAATDPEVKQAIKEKLARLQLQGGQPKTAVDFSDPVSVQRALEKTMQQLLMLEDKARDVSDPATLHRIQADLDGLSKQLHSLQARLAELQAGK